MTACERAYAKINLYLDVGAPRPDGFHSIKTVMHSVTLFDEVSVEVTPSEKTQISTLVLDMPQIPSENNLATRAVRLYLEALGENALVDIKIKKNIPVSAGLAGGSSDAAATLSAINRAYGGRLSETQLFSVAEKIGSDVPFCLIGGTALCEGRGEIIKKRYTPPPLYLVIAVSDERVSTPKAYSSLDLHYNGFDGSVSKKNQNVPKLLKPYLEGRDKLPKALYNIFEDVILPTAPVAQKIKEMLGFSGASLALMSGSGPAVFGIFDTRAMAEECASKMAREGILAFYAESV